MAKKIFKYRGKTLEELQQMSLEEFANLLTSRKRRSVLRGFNPVQKNLLKRVRKNTGKVLKTHARDMVILPEFVGKTFGVYNGKEYKNITITPEMIGLFMGEMSYTRNVAKHSAPGMGATRSSKFVSLK